MHILFDGFCGLYKKSSRNPGTRIFLRDAPCGSLIGHTIHCYPELEGNQFTAETSEKTKLIRIDLEGFNRYMKGFLDAKHNKIITFLNTIGILKRTRSQFNSFMNLVTLFNSRKVMSNTVIVRQDETCKFLYFINYGKFILLRNIDFIEALDEPLQNFVRKDASDTQNALIELEKTLPFANPKDFPCSYSRKLM